MRDRVQPGAVHTPTRLAETPIPRATMPAFSPVRRSARGAARVVPFDPVAEALRPQSAHKVKKPKAFYIESVMEIRKTQYHEEFGTNNGGFCKVMMREGEMAVVKDSTQRRPSATAATAGRQVTSPDGTRAFPLSPTSKHLSVRIAYAINSADSGRRRGADRLVDLHTLDPDAAAAMTLAAEVYREPNAEYCDYDNHVGVPVLAVRFKRTVWPGQQVLTQYL